MILHLRGTRSPGALEWLYNLDESPFAKSAPGTALGRKDHLLLSLPISATPLYHVRTVGTLWGLLGSPQALNHTDLCLGFFLHSLKPLVVCGIL